MSGTTDDERGRGQRGFFSRVTDPVADLLHREFVKLEESIKAKIDAAKESVTSSIQSKVDEYKASVVAFVVGAVLAVLGLLVLVAAAVLALTLVLQPWAAALVVAATFFLVAALLFWYGKRSLPGQDDEAEAAQAAADRAAARARDEVEDVDHIWTD